jgi:hypothetical protein
MVVLGVGLLVLGVGTGDASAQQRLSGPGVNGILQGGMCIAELTSYAADVSYFAGNGGIAAMNSQDWVQCPVADLTGLSSSIPVGVQVWIENPSTTSGTECLLHRVSLATGFITATTTLVTPTSMTSVQAFSISEPSGGGGFLSLECLLAPGATLLGYFVNEAS